MYSDIVDNSVKYLAAQQQWKGKPLLYFLYTLVLLTATCRSTTTGGERVAEFTWRKWLCENVAMLIYSCIA